MWYVPAFLSKMMLDEELKASNLWGLRGAVEQDLRYSTEKRKNNTR